MPSFFVIVSIVGAIVFIVCVPFVVLLFMGLSYARRALRGGGVDRHRESREFHHLRRRGGEHLGPVGGRRGNPHLVDVPLGPPRPPSALPQIRIPPPPRNTRPR